MSALGDLQFSSDRVADFGRVVWILLRLGSRFVFSFAAWFPGGATVYHPCSIECPHPLRTGRAQLTHPLLAITCLPIAF